MTIECATAKRQARWLGFAVILAMLAIVAGNVLVALAGVGDVGAGMLSATIRAPESLTGHRWLVLIDSVVVSLILLHGLYRLLQLTRRFERGDFFSVAAVAHLRAFASALLLATLAGCFLPAFELVAARAFGLVTVTSLAFALDSADVWMILVSAVFFAITTILGQARRLAEDHDLIV